MSEPHHLADRVGARLPDDDVTLATVLVGGGVASAALFGGWVATQVPGPWAPVLLAASMLIVPAIFAAILASADE